MRAAYQGDEAILGEPDTRVWPLSFPPHNGGEVGDGKVSGAGNRIKSKGERVTKHCFLLSLRAKQSASSSSLS